MIVQREVRAKGSSVDEAKSGVFHDKLLQYVRKEIISHLRVPDVVQDAPLWPKRTVTYEWVTSPTSLSF